MAKKEERTDNDRDEDTGRYCPCSRIPKSGWVKLRYRPRVVRMKNCRTDDD